MGQISNKFHSIFNPDEFQGWGKTRNYFEGWYFKVVDQKEFNAFAIIPGIAMNENGQRQAFIQILDGKKLTAKYHRFDSDLFSSSEKKFRIKIQDNYFSAHEIILNLPDIQGTLQFENLVPWPNKWYSPGIMGPYSFLPLMECYHGIVSMDHSIDGHLQVNGETLNFDGGRGYIEKDWGHSFPKAYIWMQTNHFSQPGISLKTSVAKIPYMGYSFVGFIAGLWFNNELIQFTTYNQSFMQKLMIDTSKVELILRNKNYILRIRTNRETATSLASPIRGLMDGRIEESMNACIEVKLINRKTNKIVFEDVGRNGGLEVAGKIEQIIRY